MAARKLSLFNPIGIEINVQRELCRVKILWMYGGYKIDILTENLTERDEALLICQWCKGIMREACISSNGEQLCSCCEGLRVFRLSSKQQLVNSLPQTPNVAVRKMVDSLKCRCPLSIRGCNWLGTLKDCEEHLETCGFIRDECKLGCREVLERYKLKVHEIENCPEREVSCQHCSQKLKFRELSIHLAMCPRVEVSCELCVKKMCRQDMTQHLEKDCVEKEIECPFAKYKCEMKSIKRKYLNQHLEEKRTEHLELKVNALELKLTALEELLEEFVMKKNETN